jgi:hypothetical protein
MHSVKHNKIDAILSSFSGVHGISKLDFLLDFSYSLALENVLPIVIPSIKA